MTRLVRNIGVMAALFVAAGAAPAIDVEKGQPEYGTQVQLNRYLQVRGWWSKDGLRIAAVRRGGPATRMTSPDGQTTAAIEPGDTIVEVQGTKIESQADYAKATTAPRTRTTSRSRCATCARETFTPGTSARRPTPTETSEPIRVSPGCRV